MYIVYISETFLNLQNRELAHTHILPTPSLPHMRQKVLPLQKHVQRPGFMSSRPRNLVIVSERNFADMREPQPDVPT